MRNWQGVVLVDAGNTALKWARLQALGFGPVQHTPSAPFRDASHMQQHVEQWLLQGESVCEVWLSSVLGAQFEQCMQRVCAQYAVQLNVVSPNAHPLLHTRYVQPSQLGKDRWAALLAVAQRAQALGGAALHLVLGLGTATTVDALVHSTVLEGYWAASTPWVHVGGFIIPGVHTMINSLHQQTAQLPQVELQMCDWPTHTEAAIGAGVGHAHLAMAVHCAQSLEAQYGQKPAVWLSGGHADFMHQHTALRHAHVLEHAVLHGVCVAFDHPVGAA